MKDSALFIITLLKCEGIGRARVFKFILENNFDINKCQASLLKIVPEVEYQEKESLAIEELNRNYDSNIKITTIFDDSFPSKLYTISNPVIYLYYLGNIKLLNTKSVAIIGTRKPDPNIEENINRLSQTLVNKKYTIISGLAIGVDTMAHKSCLDNQGSTIAVMPSGLDNIQPLRNRNLAKKILQNKGCLVSEYPVNTILQKYNYAQRDRIQSALANVIIVPEAKEKSGTMIAVDKAIKENKKVFQFPSNNNTLIKEIFDMNNLGHLQNLISTIEKNCIDQKTEYEELLKLNKKTDQISLF